MMTNWKRCGRKQLCHKFEVQSRHLPGGTKKRGTSGIRSTSVHVLVRGAWSLCSLCECYKYMKYRQKGCIRRFASLSLLRFYHAQHRDTSFPVMVIHSDCRLGNWIDSRVTSVHLKFTWAILRCFLVGFLYQTKWSVGSCVLLGGAVLYCCLLYFGFSFLLNIILKIFKRKRHSLPVTSE
jgi:hypothetical protein